MTLNRHCEELEKPPCAQARGRIPDAAIHFTTHCLWIASLTLAMTIILSAPTFAEETKEEAKTEEVKKEDPSTRYAPEHCDFEITFPSAPYTAKRCPEGIGKCYALTGYTMVYDLSTTVDVSVTCVPSTPENYDRYNERVIKAALNGMVGRAGVTEFNINTRELVNMRQGSLVGSGSHGNNQEKIYNAQLWVGQNSVFTVESKLVGASHPEADAVFRDILQSIKVKQTPTPAATKEAPTEKDDD